MAATVLELSGNKWKWFVLSCKLFVKTPPMTVIVKQCCAVLAAQRELRSPDAEFSSLQVPIVGKQVRLSKNK